MQKRAIIRSKSRFLNFKRASRYPLADFADNRQYWGHTFALLHRAETFLMDHVPIAGRVIPGKMVREDQPWYPPRATREALANALCHRDYIIPGGAVALAMYDDHLEVTNPGALQFGITPEKLAKPHESKPWNPIIANVFYRAGIIERWGAGTLNIIDWCAENGNPAPVWQEQAGSVYVNFLPAVLPDIPEMIGEAGVHAGVHDGVHVQLSDMSIKLLDCCQTPSSTPDILKVIGYKTRTRNFRKALDGLIENRLIEMTIPNKPRSKNQRYRLTGKGRAVLKEKSGR